MNSSVKFFDPIVSVVDALAALRRISFGAGAVDGVALEDSVDSSPPPPHPASNRTSTMGAATRRRVGCGDAPKQGGAIPPRPRDGGRGISAGLLDEPSLLEIRGGDVGGLLLV